MFKIKEDRENRKVFFKTEKLIDSQKQAIRKAFYASGKDLKKTANSKILEKPKHGRTYRKKKGNRTVIHVASAPGEAPANFTSNLRKSLIYKVSGWERMEFGVSADAYHVNYGGFLEDGTSKMAARPYLWPSIQENYKNIQIHFEEALKQEIKK